jgi:hypothetical protein
MSRTFMYVRFSVDLTMLVFGWLDMIGTMPVVGAYLKVKALKVELRTVGKELLQ